MPKPKVKFDVTAKDKTKGAFSKVHKSLGAMKMAGIAAVAALVAVFVKLSTQILKTGDLIHKLSIRLGISTEALSELRHAAELSGVKVEALTTGLQRMTRRVSEAAQGTGEAKNAIKELGLDIHALARMKPDEQFEAIADAIYSMKDPADKVRVAFKLFDTEGVAFLQMMDKGAAGIRELRRETKTVFTQQDANRIAAFNDAMTRFKDSATAAAKTILLELIPAIQALGPVTTKITGYFKGFFGVLKQIAGPQTDLTKLESNLGKVDKKIADIRKRMTDSEGMKFWKEKNVKKLAEDLYKLRLQRNLLVQTIERERQAILKKNAAEKDAEKIPTDKGDLKVDKKLAAERLKIQSDLTEKIKQLTLSEFDYQRWKLDEEIKVIEESNGYQESMASDLAEYKKLQLKKIAAAQAGTIADQIAEEGRLTRAIKAEIAKREKLHQEETDQRRKDLDQLREEILVASNDFAAGMKRGFDEYLKYSRSGFEQIQNLAYDTAQSMENAFATMLFDAMTGRLENFGDYLESFFNALSRSLANILAENVTKGFTNIFKDISGSFVSSGGQGYDMGKWLDEYDRNVGGIRTRLGG